ncbi:hypothetical protein ACO1O0_006834 [Amphichorda felina]
MSGLKYYSYPGVGEWARDKYSYSQAVRIGDRIECSGQGGWDFQDGWTFPSDLKEEISKAFASVDKNLRDAGGKGCSQVFRINSYHTNMTEEVVALMAENIRKWMPDHKPIWTAVGVANLVDPDMHVEIAVVAYDP